MDSFTFEALRRLPLAEACLRVWAYVADEAFLHGVFERSRGRSYEKVLSFAVMVYLIANVLLQDRGSGRRSFEKDKEAGFTPASVEAIFGKLRRLPIPLSMGFLTECTLRLLELFPDLVAPSALPGSLAHLEGVILDGKAIKKVAKRLKALRGVAGGVLGGRALVAYHVRHGVVVGMIAHADGLVNDVRFVPELLPGVRAVVPGPRIYLGDRQFCNLEHLPLYLAEGDHFLIRYHQKVTFTPDPTRSVRQGVDGAKRPYREEWGWLGSEKHRQRRYVRRLTLERPGAEPIVLVTDLGADTEGAERYAATDLLALYRVRWNIERVFQQVTEVYNLQGLLGSTPEATVFQFAFCLVLYNILQLVKAYVTAAAPKKAPDAKKTAAETKTPDEKQTTTKKVPDERKAPDVSTEKLFADMQDQLIAWNALVGPAETLRLIEPLDAATTRHRLSQLLSNVWTERWRKAKAQKRRSPEHNGKRCHASAFRLMEEARAQPKSPKGAAAK